MPRPAAWNIEAASVGDNFVEPAAKACGLYIVQLAAALTISSTIPAASAYWGKCQIIVTASVPNTQNQAIDGCMKRLITAKGLAPVARGWRETAISIITPSSIANG